MALARISVLISGRGSNLGALIDAAQRGAIDGAITQVVSNRAEAQGLDIARAHGIATAVVDHRTHAERLRFDAALDEALAQGEPDLVVLAGFMRVLGDAFVRKHEGRLVNVHPSLLPLYPGLNTHARALADGVRVHGCTVHFVTPVVDVGPIIAQGAVPVLPDDDEARLAARVLAVEHRVLPAAVAWICRGDVALVDGRVRFRDVPPDARAALLSPPATRT
jgi:phosphoribosylglycinamide formyltransferase-1